MNVADTKEPVGVGTFQEFGGLRSVADKKEPCGCGVLSRSVRG